MSVQYKARLITGSSRYLVFAYYANGGARCVWGKPVSRATAYRKAAALQRSA